MKLLKYLSVICLIIGAVSCSKSLESSSGNGVATNGSLSAFVIVENYMYAVNGSQLITYDITVAAKPIFKNTQTVGFNIQTILPYKGNLFIGSETAMYIYSLSKPEAPIRQSQINYFVRGKDPVIALDTVAYSTVRTGPTGSLNVFNIKNISNPSLVRSLQIDSPYGLGIKSNILYVCTGVNGIYMYDITSQLAPNYASLFSINEEVFDVIIDNNMMVCYFKGGVAFIDLKNPLAPELISKVKN